MEKLIEENYKSIVSRGLITPATTRNQFIDKLFEEVAEFEEANDLNDWCNINEELADVILVCLNFAKHYKIDIKKELTNKIKNNYERAARMDDTNSTI